MKVSISLLSLLFLLVLAPSIVFATDPISDPFYSQGTLKDPPPMNIMSENIDPFSGILTISYTDVHLPGNGGLDINLVRTYNSNIWGRRDSLFGPQLFALDEKSPLTFGWSMHMGIVRNPAGTNPVFITPDGSKHVFYSNPNGPGFISKEYWIYRNISSGVWEITTTDGTVYTIKYGTSNAGYDVNHTVNNLPPNPPTLVTDQIGQVTQIRNSAATAYIYITYNSTYHYLINNITDTASHAINFNYTNNGQFLLTSITVDNRTFTYSYANVNGYTRLTAFNPPVGNAWHYGYEPNGGYELNSITYPEGGIIGYSYGDVSLATGGTLVSFRVITGRTTSGTNIPAGSWTYTYNSGGSNGDIRTITGAGVTQTDTYYGWGNTGNGTVWKTGLLISKAYSGNFNLTESYSWTQSNNPVSNDDISNASWTNTSGQNTGGTKWDSVIYVPYLSSKSITRDGKTYTTTYSDFDSYGNPKTISEISGTGDVNRSKTIDYYWTNTSKNIVAGKPNSETVTGSFSGTSTTSWQYDANSGNVTQINANGVVTKYGYDGQGNLSSITDANDHQTAFLWDKGLVSRKTNPIYYVSRSINADGTIDDETDGRFYKTIYSHDKNLRLTGITPPIGNPTTISYPDDSSFKVKTRGSYSLTEYFDGFGRPSGSSDTKGMTTTIVYNAYGVKDYSDSNTGDRTYYDYFGRPKRVVHKNNYEQDYAYSGSSVTVTDENNANSTLTYVAFGNPDEKYLISVKDQAGNTTSYSRNILGLLTGISQSGVDRSYSYNDKFFLDSETNPETGTITYERDNVGNMTSRSDSADSRNYTYDSINRLKNISSGSGSISYDYDDADNRISMSSPSAAISYEYDGANRMWYKGESIAGQSYSTSYHYDDNDNIDEIIYPSSRIVDFRYNDNNQVSSIPGFVTDVSYHMSGVTAGLPSSFTLSNNQTTTFSYDYRRAINAIFAWSGINVGYDHDSRGNTISFTSDLFPNQGFSYDELNRMSVFNGSWGSGVFHYDDVGNRTEKDVASTVTTYGYTSNCLTSATGGEAASYSYNGDGSLSGGTWDGASYTLGYDGFGNLTSFNSGTTELAGFGYDGDGMRVYKTAGGKTTVYHYDQVGRVISEDDGNGNYIADYIYLNGKLVAKVANDAFINPVAPTGLTATVMSATSINLAWQDNSTNESEFLIERKTGVAGGYTQIATVGANVTAYTDAGLSENTSYFYRIRATNAIGNSGYSSETSATISPPLAPSGLTATVVSTTQIALTWIDNSSDETQFILERKTGGNGTYVQIATVGANVTTYTDSGLTLNTAYYYRVKCSNVVGSSTYSNQLDFSTYNAITTFTCPSGGTLQGTSCVTASTYAATQFNVPLYRTGSFLFGSCHSDGMLGTSNCGGIYGYAANNSFTGAIPVYRTGSIIGSSCYTDGKVGSSGCGGVYGYAANSSFTGAIPEYQTGAQIGGTCVVNGKLGTSGCGGVYGYIASSSGSYMCNSGDTLNSGICTHTTSYSATLTYSCNTGDTLSGTICTHVSN